MHVCFLARMASRYRKAYILPLWFLADVNLRSRSLYAIADPSVCRPSVCYVGAPYSGGAKNRWWGTPLSPEICVQSDPPPFKQRNFDQYRLIAPQP